MILKTKSYRVDKHSKHSKTHNLMFPRTFTRHLSKYATLNKNVTYNTKRKQPTISSVPMKI